VGDTAKQLLSGRRALVIGLAREGLDLVRFLTAHGASVTVSDQKSPEQLGEAIEQLQVEGLLGGQPVDAFSHADLETRLADRARGEPAGELDRTRVTLKLGGHDLSDLDGVDVVYPSPGVPPQHVLLVAARQRGIELSSLVQLFFALCPASILGITGSAGKSTTTSLVGDIFAASGREVFVGGNIGRPMLGLLERMSERSSVVMELSSFQLEPLRQSPHIALITNVTPNHLDRHPSMEAYWSAKGQILAHQAPTDCAILNADDPWSLRYAVNGRVLRFSLDGVVDGAYLADTRLMLLGEPLLDVAEVPLRGRHNLANVLAASAAAHAAGIEREPMRAAIRAFKGVPHRLQTVVERDGVQFVNDSIATAPERSIAAIRAYDEPLVLIAGGRDKHLPMEAWAELIVHRVKHVVLFGEMSDLVDTALRSADPSYIAISRAGSMDEAVRRSAAAAESGDVVLLSPGGTSYDMYQDFEERGRDFARAANAL
jgi:UDP-N-acetylmuramoylalanine--D-glutamate ligase